MSKRNRPQKNIRENIKNISLEVKIKSRWYSMIKTTHRYKCGVKSIENQIKNGNKWNSEEPFWWTYYPPKS